MTDNIVLDPGSGGATCKTDDDGTAHWQYVKLAYGADNTQTRVTASVGLPAVLLAGTAEFGKLAAGTAEIGSVKWAGTAPPIGAGTEAAALRVTLATDSTGVITVDNGGTFATQATLQAGTAEFGKLAAGVAEIGNIKNSGTFAVQAAATNAGTFVVQEDGAALTALQLIDDAIFTDNSAFTPATSKVMVMGGVFQTGTPGILADNDAGAFLLNSTSALMVELLAGSAEIGTVGLAAGTAEIGKLAAGVAEIGNVKNSGTFATQATLQAGTAAFGKLAANSGVDIGDVDILSIAAGDNNIGNVDIVTLPASTNTIEVVGDVAHDAAAAGNPVLIGSRATAAIEALTEVAEADASYVATDLQGVVITRPYITAQEHVQYHVVNTAGTELAVTGLNAGGAGVHNYVTAVMVHNAHASTNGFIQLLDGSAGTVLATFPAPATGGVVINLTQPLKQTTANTALYWDASAAITTLYVTIIGYQGQG